MHRYLYLITAVYLKELPFILVNKPSQRQTSTDLFLWITALTLGKRGFVWVRKKEFTVAFLPRHSDDRASFDLVQIHPRCGPVRSSNKTH